MTEEQILKELGIKEQNPGVGLVEHWKTPSKIQPLSIP